MSHFERKVVNLASREMLGRISILDSTKFPGQLLPGARKGLLMTVALQAHLSRAFFVETVFSICQFQF